MLSIKHFYINVFFASLSWGYTYHFNKVVKQTPCTFKICNIQPSSLEINVKSKWSVAPPWHHNTGHGQQGWEETRKWKLDSLTSKILNFRPIPHSPGYNLLPGLAGHSDPQERKGMSTGETEGKIQPHNIPWWNCVRVRNSRLRTSSLFSFLPFLNSWYWVSFSHHYLARSNWATRIFWK